MNGLTFKVSFTFNRQPLRVQHRALELTGRHVLWEAELKSDIKLRPELALCQDKAKCMLKLWGNQAAENSRKQVNRGRPMTKTKLPLREAGKGQSLGGLTS